MRAAGAELHLAPGVLRAYGLAVSLMLRRASWPLNLPYFLRPGGSVPLGCVGYVEAAIELAAQIEAGELPAPSHLVVPLGSGGTAAGLAAGLKLAGLRTRLVCVLVNDLIRVDERTVARLARRTLRLLRKRGANVGEVEGSVAGVEQVRIAAADFAMERGWLGDGYGHSTPAAGHATELLAEREDVVLEPVYTAKAVAALLELNRRGAFGAGPVLYWHTYSRPQDD
jgi:D-cysteine desulfhydrase